MASTQVVITVKGLQDLQQALALTKGISQQVNLINKKKINLSVGTSGGGGGSGGASLTSSANQLSRLLGVTGKNITEFTSRVGRVPGIVAGFADQFVHLGQVLSTFAYRMTLVTAPITAFVASAGKAAIELEKSTLKVATQLDATRGVALEFARSTEQAMTTLATNTGVSAVKLSDALYLILSSMDVAQSEATKMMAPIAMAAVAGVAEPEEVVRATTSAFNVFGKELERFGGMGEQTRHVVDVLFEAVKVGRAELEDIATGFGRAAEMGQLAGGTFEDVVAIVAALSRVFTPGQATTTAENFYKTLVDPTDEAIKVWDELKISMFEVVDGVEKRRGPMSIFGELMEKIGGMKASEVEAVMTSIFGTIRSMRGALFLQDPGNLQDVLGWADKWAGMSPEVGGMTTGVGAGFSLVAEGVDFLIDRLDALKDALGQDMLSAFREDITGVLDLFAGLLETLGEMDPAVQKNMWQWGVMLVALGPLSLVLGTMLMGLGGLVTTIGRLISPAGLAGLIVAWTGLKDIAGTTWAVVKEYMEEGGLKGLIKLVADLAVEFGVLGETDADELLEGLGISTSKIDSPKFREFVDAAKELGESAKNTWEGIKNWFEAFGKFIDQTVSGENNFGKLVENVKELATWLLGLAGVDLAGISGDVDKMAAAIDNLVTKLAKWAMLGASLNMLSRFIGLVTSLAGVLAGPFGIPIMVILGTGATVTGIARGVEATGSKLAEGGEREKSYDIILEHMQQALLAAGTTFGWDSEDAKKAYLDYRDMLVEAIRETPSGVYEMLPGLTDEDRNMLADKYLTQQPFNGVVGMPPPTLDSYHRMGYNVPGNVIANRALRNMFKVRESGLISMPQDYGGIPGMYPGGENMYAGMDKLWTYLTQTFTPPTSPQFWEDKPTTTEMPWWYSTVWSSGKGVESRAKDWLADSQYDERVPQFVKDRVLVALDELSDALANDPSSVAARAAELSSILDESGDISARYNSKVKAAGTALENIAKAIAGGQWWEDFKKEHGGTDPTEEYKRHAKPLVAATADRLWGEDFFKRTGRAPERADWDAMWYQYYGPVESYPGGPIGEATAHPFWQAALQQLGDSAEAQGVAAETLEEVLAGKMDDSIVVQEDIQFAVDKNKEAIDLGFSTANGYLEAIDATTKAWLNKIGLNQGDENDSGPRGGGEQEGTGIDNNIVTPFKPTTTTGSTGIPRNIPEFAAGGYAFVDKIYRLAERGRPEFVLDNPTTRLLENRMGVLTQEKLAGMAGGGPTTMHVGNINLPNVTNYEEFMRDLAREADGLVRVGYVQ